MKKTLLILGICSVIIACSSNNKTGSSADTNLTEENPSAVASGKGEELITKSDCLTCHKVDLKLLGPAYQEVAAKYPATDENIEMLAGKIIKGGAGNWGDIPMAPHPSISEDDAKEMVKYILSLKK